MQSTRGNQSPGEDATAGCSTSKKGEEAEASRRITDTEAWGKIAEKSFDPIGGWTHTAGYSLTWGGDFLKDGNGIDRCTQPFYYSGYSTVDHEAKYGEAYRQHYEGPVFVVSYGNATESLSADEVSGLLDEVLALLKAGVPEARWLVGKDIEILEFVPLCRTTFVVDDAVSLDSEKGYVLWLVGVDMFHVRYKQQGQGVVESVVILPQYSNSRILELPTVQSARLVEIYHKLRE